MPGPFRAGSRPARIRRGGDRVPQPKGDCCAMVAAGRAARRGEYRLARRYAVWSVRLVVARLA